MLVGQRKVLAASIAATLWLLSFGGASASAHFEASAVAAFSASPDAAAFACVDLEDSSAAQIHEPANEPSVSMVASGTSIAPSPGYLSQPALTLAPKTSPPIA